MNEVHRMATLDRANEAIALTVENGGGTFHAASLIPFTPLRGFAVGVGGVILDPEKTDGLRLLRTVEALADEFETLFVGTWLDGDDLYVDAVRYFGPGFLPEAMLLGRQTQQQTIYDFATGDVISLATEA